MIRCQRCGHANFTGAVFCLECGVILAGRVTAEGTPTSAGQTGEAERPPPTVGPWATLYVEDSSKAFHLELREEFTLGRGDASRDTKPDIDLSPFEAYTHGVSRMHAVIRRRGHQIVLMDLDSANGTFVNGRRLGSRQETGVRDGDVIVLGALTLQVRVKRIG
jgi:hypothetical protein